MTLIEVVISSGLVGLIFVVIMGLMGQVGSVASFFSSQEATMTAVVDAVGSLNATMPLVTRITACNCRAVSSRAQCIWDSSQPWTNPVFDMAQTSPVTLLAGEFEVHDGPGTAMTDVLNLASFGPDTCLSQNSTGSTYSRGCKVGFELKYTAPTALTSSAASKAGTLRLEIPARGAGAPARVSIGAATAEGAGNIGVTELSCGFDNGAGSATGANFVLNFRVKARSRLTKKLNDPNYESWYPRAGGSAPYQSDKNYFGGQIREIRLKWAMRNITARGIYSWRGESTRNCKINGATAGNSSQCCSNAINAGICVACVRGGQGAAAASACCSGRLAGGGLCN